MRQEELRRAFLEYGPSWIRDREAVYGMTARGLPAAVGEHFWGFFGTDVERARVAVGAIVNYRVQEALLGEVPADVSEERFIDAFISLWTTFGEATLARHEREESP